MKYRKKHAYRAIIEYSDDVSVEMETKQITLKKFKKMLTTILVKSIEEGMTYIGIEYEVMEDEENLQNVRKKIL